VFVFETLAALRADEPPDLEFDALVGATQPSKAEVKTSFALH
jgi:hypothetical protein